MQNAWGMTIICILNALFMLDFMTGDNNKQVKLTTVATVSNLQLIIIWLSQHPGYHTQTIPQHNFILLSWSPF